MSYPVSSRTCAARHHCAGLSLPPQALIVSAGGLAPAASRPRCPAAAAGALLPTHLPDGAGRVGLVFGQLAAREAPPRVLLPALDHEALLHAGVEQDGAAHGDGALVGVEVLVNLLQALLEGLQPGAHLEDEPRELLERQGLEVLVLRLLADVVLRARQRQQQRERRSGACAAERGTGRPRWVSQRGWHDMQLTS